MIHTGSLRRILTCLRPISGLAGLVVLTQCAHHETLVLNRDPAMIERKNETFGFRKWVSKTETPDIVIVALHGFDGASIDYENLGKDLLLKQPKTALYAYEVRGQGSDPKRDRRGDIDTPSDWYRDLLVFNDLVKKRHPGAKIVWMGESMGALITAHTWEQHAEGPHPCDAMIFSSPVVQIRKDVPAWKVGLLDVAAAAAPKARVSLEQISGGQDVQMTHTTKHTEQAETNAWHVEKNTLRLLSTLGHHIKTMDECAATIRVPVLILHGKKDFFTDETDVWTFTASIPKTTPVTTRIYPDAYHLLMYDTHKDEVIHDIEKWVDRLRK